MVDGIWFVMNREYTKLICWAMRGQPYRGLRFFISTMASMTPLLGPLGPGFLPPRGEYSSRYLRFFRAL
jgi:hypothetical protein